MYEVVFSSFTDLTVSKRKGGTKRWIYNVRTYVLALLLCFLISMAGIFFSYRPILADTTVSDAAGHLSASVDHESAPLGSIVILTMTYRLPEGARLPQNPEIKGLEDVTVIDRDIQPNTIRVRLLIDSLESWKTDTLTLMYRDRDNQTRALTASPVSVKVVSNLGEKPADAQLKTIRDIIPARPAWLTYMLWSSAFIGIILAGTGLFRFYRRKRRQQYPTEKPDPPHIHAIKSIEELVNGRLFEQGHIKEFYFRFTEILRHYLESLRGFPAAEYTTEEIARCITEERDRHLLSLLRQADLVKFADVIPTPVRKEEEVITALSYIRETSSFAESSELKNSYGGKIP